MSSHCSFKKDFTKITHQTALKSKNSYYTVIGKFEKYLCSYMVYPFRPNQHDDFDRIVVLIFCLFGAFSGFLRLFCLIFPIRKQKEPSRIYSPGRFFSYLFSFCFFIGHCVFLLFYPTFTQFTVQIIVQITIEN